MTINSTTKISALIKENEKVIDAIASVNKHFTKLKNPILRKILASRVSIADAAKIGNVDISILFNKLKEIGFKIESYENDSVKKTANTYNTQLPAQNINLIDVIELDVRENISNGEDPFNLIMGQIKILPEDKTLKIINTFEPIPLINILKKKGYTHYTETKESNLIFTYFKKTTANNDTFQIIAEEGNDSYEDLVNKYTGRIEEIDVRNLEMPAPMISILKKIESLKEDQALLVHHKKIPQFLFPELQENNFSWSIKTIDEKNVKLLIYKTNAKH